jgi:hypothetical protein
MGRYWGSQLQKSTTYQQAKKDLVVGCFTILPSITYVVSGIMAWIGSPLTCVRSYNSSIFKLQVGREYTVNVISTITNATTPLPDRWKYLKNDEWRAIYGADLVSGYGDLTLIVDLIQSYPMNASFLPVHGMIHLEGNSTWPSARQVQPPAETLLFTIPITQDDWFTPDNHSTMHIAGALSEQTKNQSQVQISLLFLAIVIVFNVLKGVVMVLTLIDKQHDLLLTCGDAVASFLERPEKLTEGYSVASKTRLLKRIGPSKNLTGAKADPSLMMGDKWKNRTRRYRSSTGSVMSTIILL